MTITKNHIIKLIKQNVRLDGRKNDEYRKPIKVELGVTEGAEGSARVIIGDTEVIVGVKMEIMSPYPDSPDQGTIMVGAELIPFASPDYESGPPSIKAIELARVIDRGVRESKCLDFKSMCIKSGEKVWVCAIDIIPINAAGNMFDAGAIGALAALMDTKLPALEEKDGVYKINYEGERTEKIKLNNQPISCTVLKIGDNFVVDPLPEEEEIYDARLTVAVDESGDICAMQKGGDHALSADEIMKMVELASKKCGELRKFLPKK